MNLTAAQKEAIEAPGNVLLVAGAGTGKTRTLVERCLFLLVEAQPRASLEEVLLVTFTEAAATEMRGRIRERLLQESAKNPEDAHWQEQIALFETARIGTFHSFCLELIRQHFYQLALDPQLSVLAEEEARLLAEETLEELLQTHYAGQDSQAQAVQSLIQVQGSGSDRLVRALVLRLHRYTQSLPDPAGWLRQQVLAYEAGAPQKWVEWLNQALADWRAAWLPALHGLAAHNALAAECAAVLLGLPPGAGRAEVVAALGQVTAIASQCPNGKKGLWHEPLKEFFAETAFLRSVAQSPPGPPNLPPATPHNPASAATPAALPNARQGPAVINSAPGSDPLAQDWEWVRHEMLALLRLAQDFAGAFAEAKRELGAVDFADIEQYALGLLWDSAANEPTKIARQWRKKIRYVFVDEYQDINAAQDKIIQALSREAAEANRFLVGDVKQSIYRFRLAAPHVFQGYIRQWAKGEGRVIPLVDNFRSREGILLFVNSLFERLMRPELGSVSYDEMARLAFGAPLERRLLSASENPAPCVELHLCLKGGAEPSDPEPDSAEGLAEARDLEEPAKEARQVALRLLELRASRHPIWDEQSRQFRSVEWRDMAVLLRAPAGKAESFAKEFSALEVPLQVARAGFYESLEVSDLLNLLQLLDNPLQDVPALGVLRSPLVGLTLNELALIRLAAPKAHFWTALLRWNRQPQSPIPASGNATKEANDRESPSVIDPLETGRKTATFLERFARWRRLARQVSLSQCLEAVLAETHYSDWLWTQPRGQQRQANVMRLLKLAQQFDRFQRQGLFRFLRFIEAQQSVDSEPETPSLNEENSVSLLSIHQSKGLEFPVVVVADLGKLFNLSDLRAGLILDELYGLCPRIKPPHSARSYPSLPHWLARRRQLRELLAEEMRLLYVAITRARDTLLLSANIARTRFERLWKAKSETGTDALLSARSYADWLGLWFSQHVPQMEPPQQGQTELLRWFICDEDAALRRPNREVPPPGPVTRRDAALDSPVLEKLRRRLAWRYPHEAATSQSAKSSVSLLRRQAAEKLGEEATFLFGAPSSKLRSPRSRVTGENASPRLSTRPSAAEIGNAHHAFLEGIALDRAGSKTQLEAEAKRLERAGHLAIEEVALLDFKALAAFWGSGLGARIRAQTPFVHRELPFTVRFRADEIAALLGLPAQSDLQNEFVIVQGVVDLAVILPNEIWLLDFKTDDLRPAQLSGKLQLYEPQLKLYARALAQVYKKPVSESWLYFLHLQQASRVQ